MSEVSELFLLVLLLCDVTIAAALSCALGDTRKKAAQPFAFRSALAFPPSSSRSLGIADTMTEHVQRTELLKT